ncbi:MAG: hypothetical protein CMP53_04020 [Flavobacteriales bacterium]|mgnify:CR=1 FL=1|nr:hypothetical protein [Flavobacteriales bacterium]|tara:strand:- start:3455 stop:5938 length:2484 start_codon:yes stop_codon:yes gene_type:complete
MYRQLRLFFIIPITFLSVFLPSAYLHAQVQDKNASAEPFQFWVDHLPYNTFSHVDQIDQYIFAASSNNLLVINSNSDEITRFSRINGLSGSNITSLKADKVSGTVWIGYANGRIDIWSSLGIFSISAIEETPSYTGLKRINDISFYNGFAYIATDFGLVEFNVSSRLAGRTLLLGENFSPIAIETFDINPSGIVCAYSPSNNKLFYFGDLNQTLPNWETSNFSLFVDNYNPQHITYFPEEERFIFAVDDLASGTYLLAMTETIANQWEAEGYSTPFQGGAGGQDIQDIMVTENWLVLTRDFNIIARKSTAKNTFGDSLNISNALFAPGVLRPICAVHNENDGSIYIGNFRTGLIRVREGNKVKRFLPPSPFSDRSYKVISYGEGRNFTFSNALSPGGPMSFGGVILAPGALTDLWTRTFVADGASIYTDQEWINLSNENLFGVTDIVDAAFKISGTGEIEMYLSSWGKGLVKLEGIGEPESLDTVAFFNTTNTGGVLKGVGGNASDLRAGGITFDENGTLWGVQSLVNTPLYSISQEGEFASYSLSPGADGVALKDIVAKDGMIFIQSRTNGIYGYTEENGVGIKRKISSGVQSGNLPSDKVLSLAFDHDGELWIGTDEGLVVLYSPDNVFDGSGNRDARPILFEEDGVVQKLLGENPVSAIHVDGGNQKWLGTRGAGLFLVSPDGLQTIHQFTAENSPLLSNTILSIATDPNTGEVIIATDAGLIGYRGTATPGYLGSVPELAVYPNPVRPGYTGPLFIQGNSSDARIKITDVSGALVNDLQAAGGQAQWNGTKIDGSTVASGVYLIYATDDLGEITAQGKVLILR